MSLRNSWCGEWCLNVLATVLLSLGVGAATAAFTVVNGVASHGVPFVACETMLEISGGPMMYASGTGGTVSSSAVVHERVVRAYHASREAAGDATGTWSDMTRDPDPRPLAPLFAAGALALLVGCARGAARLLDESRATWMIAASSMGALVLAEVLSSVAGLPAPGVRGFAFAIGVALLATRFAHATRSELVPTRAPTSS